MSALFSPVALKEGCEIVWQGLLDLLYPPRCLLCETELEEGCLCISCIRAFQPLAPPFCDRCGVQVRQAGVCEVCAEGAYPFYDGSAALAHFAGAIREAIHLLKYEERVALAEPLGDLLAEFVQKTPVFKGIAFDVVVPVPLHRSRLRQRGFNQAERLAQRIEKRNGIPLESRELVRLRATRSQASLLGDARRRNLTNAFGIRSTLPFEGKTVLLVDDVLTTMSTVSECARVLKAGGAQKVSVVALARGG